MAVKKMLVTTLDNDPIHMLAAQFNALLAKLDADVGVTDTDFAATLKIQDQLGNDVE